MAEIDPAVAVREAPRKPISRERIALLFLVMLVTAAGNTAMQSVMPSIGTELGVADVWISLAYTWSALLWVVCAPLWARRSDRRGRKAMMALGLIGFIASFALCGIILWFGLAGVLALLMRIQLAWPENDFLNPDLYGQIFSTHGADVVFTAVRGRTLYQEGRFVTMDPAAVRTRMLDGAARMRAARDGS